MKKLLVIPALFLAYAGFGQDASERVFKFGGGVELVVPANNLTPYSIGAGIDLIGHYGLTDQFALTGDIGYVGIFEKKESVYESFSIIPIRGGVRWYPIQHVYVSGRAGVGIITGMSARSTVAFAFGGGYMVDDKLDLGLAYEGYGNPKSAGYVAGSFGYVGLRLGYFFK